MAEKELSPQGPCSDSSQDQSGLEKGQPAQRTIPTWTPKTAEVSSEGELQPVVTHDDETYPEGGREAWLVVFGAWCGLFAALGLMNTIATFQSYTARNQLSAYTEGTAGWIYSIYTFIVFGCGIYIGPLFDKYGPKWLVLPGGLGVFAGVMLLSICTQYWHFILVFSLLTGLCTSLVFTPCVAAIGHFFLERRGLATGAASTGGGIGGIVFPLLLEHTFSRLGWAWAVRILGFVCLVLVTICNLLVRKRLPPAVDASPHPDFGIFRQWAFLFTTAGVFLLEFSLFIPLAYISSYALAVGFDESLSFTVLVVLNASSVLGRLLPGYWADYIGPFNSNMVCLFISIIACLAIWLPAGHTLPGLFMFAILFGFGSGSNIALTPVCVGQLCRTEQYGRYYATCYTIVSIACLIGIPIAGAILEACHGDYWGLIVITGVVDILSLAAFVAAKMSCVGWRLWTKF